MKVSREKLVELRRGGAIPGQDFYALLKQADAQALPEPEEAAQEPEKSTADDVLVRLTDVVEKLAVQPETNGDVLQALGNISSQLQEMTAATREATAARLKPREFVPVYNNQGRIIKLTVN